MIDEVLAKKFIDKIASYTSHNVNIINEQGRIIAASKDFHRVDDFHEVAWKMLQKDSNESCVTQTDDYLGVSDFLKWPAFDLTDCPSIAHFSVRQRFNDTGADAPVQSNHFSR